VIAAYRQFDTIGWEFRMTDGLPSALSVVGFLRQDNAATGIPRHTAHFRSTPPFNTAKMRQNAHRAKRNATRVEAAAGLKR
jgi:hypothetical protein